MAKKRMALGARNKLVVLQNEGPAIPDGEGGTITSWIDLDPRTLYVAIEDATQQGLERVAAGTVISSATHLLEGAYHPQVTTQTRVLYGARIFAVKDVKNPREADVDLVLVCVEVVP